MQAVSRSAIRCAAPGPIPKPCPEMPLAMKKPGIAGTTEIIGTASSTTSISPDFSRSIYPAL
jgi:hypothetical protein